VPAATTERTASIKAHGWYSLASIPPADKPKQPRYPYVLRRAASVEWPGRPANLKRRAASAVAYSE
jgi:hypothetical protein